MRIAVRVVLLMLLLLPASCRTMGVALEQFDRSSREYNRMVRWEEYAMANITFVDQGAREAYEKRVEAAKRVKVVDFRVVSYECDPAKGMATVDVEFDYYALPSATVKTVHDTQKWVYREGPDGGKWRLTTLLPEFR
jgi:hypothetical protein